MKKVLAVIASAVLAVSASQATIQVNYSSADGVFAPGTMVGIGSGLLVQVLWSATDPSGGFGVDIGNITGDFGTHRVIHSGFTPGGSVIDGTSALVPEAFLGVSEPALLGGYVYARLFSTAAPTIGDYFSVSLVTGPGLGDMDPPVGQGALLTFVAMDEDTNTEDAFQGIGTNPQQDWVQIVPEPSVLAFLGIGAALVGIRRMRRS